MSLSEQTILDARECASRYPDSRSALLPLLHLVQSEEGTVTADGIALCADVLGLTTAEVAGVATFYTMYRRRPGGKHHVGVCTTALCAVMGGDALLDQVRKRLLLTRQQMRVEKRFERVDRQMQGFENETRSFGGVKCYPALINNKVKGAILTAMRTHYDSSVLEIIAPVCVRKHLNLKDGHKVKVEVNLP